MSCTGDIIRVGIIGSGFIGDVHHAALAATHDAKVVAHADVDTARGEIFAKEHGIPRSYASHLDLVKDPEVDAVVLGTPNFLHHQMAMDAFAHGKHVICEKPLALTMEHAREMVDTAAAKGLVLGYAEELCFVPKYEEAKRLLETGGIGKPYLVRQCEKHGGPYSPWFFKRDTAGGGITMDMGCHAIEAIRWSLGKPRVKAVTALMNTYLWDMEKVRGLFGPMDASLMTQEKPLEDHVIVLMEFEDGTIGQAESSWTLQGGMDSTLDLFGTEGVIYADILKGSWLKAYSEKGFPDMWEPNQGWTNPHWEWARNNGYPQEDAHFIRCMKTGEPPIESGQDGLDVLEIMLAAYHSAGTGQKVTLPFRPKGIERPVDLWLDPRPELGAGPIEEV
jgi:myo-inositol 2-dehydrogenase / D-chiro-inositol 1-dehydrogenase